ncbi:HAMP domain-containing histidine kinase [bacterium]|nr:HAMP domain-containing histidine kinase [bacterium]MBU1957474.1 HAMP domain-containing histidine kinase [bacterium]
MNRVEVRSFLRNFIPFFITLEFLTGIIFYEEYQNEVKNLEQTIHYNMDICNFNTDDDQYACLDYTIEFFNEKKQTYTLKFLQEQDEQPEISYKKNNLFYKYYSIPNIDELHLKISYPASLYQIKIATFKSHRIQEFVLASLGVLLLTILFSFYSLAPLRHAFKLTQEFIKDILHDFNTPISSLLLNVKTLPKSKESYDKINRIEQSLNTILSLQENLKSYLNQHPKQKEQFELFKLVEERVKSLENLYPNLTFIIQGEPLWLYSNQSSMSRILDNLLNNAAKYNQVNGQVEVQIKMHSITLSDTGKGIKHAEKIFDRFYKEHERGLGIGLHIVKKLCDELGIKIKVYSKIGQGTRFTLIFP